MAAAPVFSFAGMLLLLFGGAFSGLPLGIPPGEFDPVMARVAPQECLFYVGWSGTAEPSAKSPNRTEQLLADPEVRRFVEELSRRLKAALQQGAGRGEQGRKLGEALPKLTHALMTRPAAFFVGRIDASPTGFNVPIGLVVNVGDRQAELESSLLVVDELLTRGQSTTVKDGEHTWREWPTSQGFPTLRWGFVDHYFVAAFGDETSRDIVKRMRGDDVPKWLTATRQRLAVERLSNLTYFDLAAIQNLLAQLPAGLDMKMPETFQTLGLMNLQTLSSVTGLDQSGIVSRTWLQWTGPPTGLLAPFQAAPLQATDLKVIPADASIAFAVRFDAAKAFEQFVQILQSFDQRAANQLRRELDQSRTEIGFRVKEDLLDSLGDVWRVYHSPNEGGALFTGWTAVVSARDAKKLAQVAKTLSERARQTNEEFRARAGPRAKLLRVDDYQFHSQIVYFLNMVGDELPVAPAWCVTDRELVISLFPQGVHAYLSRKADAASLAEHPAVAAQFAGQQRPLFFAHYDSPTVFKSLYPLVQIFGNILCAHLQQEGININLSLLPSQTTIAKYLQPGSTSVVTSDDGVEIVSRRTLPIGAEVVQLALPAMIFGSRFFFGFRQQSFASNQMSVLDLLSPVRAQQTASRNNLKMMGLAMHNFHDVHRKFPPAVTKDKNGKPGLSWRVHLLPFLDNAPLFNEFHLDEAWDSAHNKPLVEKMPAVYKSPGSKAEAGKTIYLTLRGKDTIFPADKDGTRLSDVVDGASNTLLVVEASDDKAVIWTKPDDLDFDPEKPLTGLKSARPDGFLGLMADGSVRFFNDSLPAETVRRLVLRNDGQTTSLD
jgi:hypothetical protein